MYHIIPAIDDTLPSNYSIYYALDAAPFTSLTYTKTSETQYNQLLFSREGLNDTSHAFYVQPVGNNKQVIFDYALHTCVSALSMENIDLWLIYLQRRG